MHYAKCDTAANSITTSFAPISLTLALPWVRNEVAKLPIELQQEQAFLPALESAYEKLIQQARGRAHFLLRFRLIAWTVTALGDLQ